MVWPRLKVVLFNKDNPTGHSERRKKKRQTEEVDLELAIDPLTPRGSFVHYDFLKQHYIRNKMTHVSPLYVGALTCNINVNYTTQNYIFRLR